MLVSFDNPFDAYNYFQEVLDNQNDQQQQNDEDFSKLPIVDKLNHKVTLIFENYIFTFNFN